MAWSRFISNMRVRSVAVSANFFGETTKKDDRHLDDDDCNDCFVNYFVVIY